MHATQMEVKYIFDFRGNGAHLHPKNSKEFFFPSGNKSETNEGEEERALM